MHRRTLLAASSPVLAGLAGPAFAAGPDNAGGARRLRFVPQSDLSSIDPLWSAAVVSATHGYMVWDTLFGLDRALRPQPQMCEGAETTADGLGWTFTLRPGLVFHDGERVRPADCIASMRRYMQKDPFMQALGARVQEMTPLDDRRWRMVLSRPFRHTLLALSLRNVFMMPERIAATPASTQFKEVVGSGPYRFLADEWQAGAHAGYARFDGYVPRAEPPSMFAGGKVARFDKVDWIVQPDPATAAAALQRGEVDLLERPLSDLVPMLERSPGIKAASLDPFGALLMLRFNQLQPPFDNPKLRQALLPGLDQEEVVTAAVGDVKRFGTVPVGVFAVGSPAANTDGLEPLTAPRDMARARRLVAESGYRGERVAMLAPSDLPQVMAASLVVQDQLKQMGLNVDLQTTDWGTMLSRLTKKEPVDQGGWSCFCVTWAGLSVATPGSSLPLRANGAAAWVGWPTDPRLEALRDEWLDAPGPAEEAAISRAMQVEAMQSLPYVPLGQWTQPMAYSERLSGLLPSPFTLFWNASKTA